MKKIIACCLLCFTFMLHHAQTSNDTIALIDKLQNNEQYTIQFSSQGCFHSEKEVITFTKENNTYYVVFNSEKKQLDRKSIKKIRNFEKELSLQKDVGCTTIDHYTLVYNQSQRTISDGSCSWRGYSNLKKELGFV